MSDATALLEVEQFFHEKIPITRAMGLQVVAHDVKNFIVEAPVALNYNHQHTAFGGSINATATLAAYGLLWLRLRGEPVNVVIRDSSIRFLCPVREAIRAHCESPSPTEWEEFVGTLRRKGKATIGLGVTVQENDEIAAYFRGTFVASMPTGTDKTPA